MSRTLRKILSICQDKTQFGNLFMDVVDDTAAKHRLSFGGGNKMPPYIKSKTNIRTKWYFGDVNKNKDGYSFRSRTGFGARQSAKNFNRSFKKGVRQQAKIEIKIELQEL